MLFICKLYLTKINMSRVTSINMAIQRINWQVSFARHAIALCNLFFFVVT